MYKYPCSTAIQAETPVIGSFCNCYLLSALRVWKTMNSTVTAVWKIPKLAESKGPIQVLLTFSVSAQ